jgi:hypothetical protein
MKTQLKYFIRRIDIADTYFTPKPKRTKVWHSIEFNMFENIDLSDSIRKKAVFKGAILVGNKFISG